jgi:hypothetical protein
MEVKKDASMDGAILPFENGGDVWPLWEFGLRMLIRVAICDPPSNMSARGVY